MDSHIIPNAPVWNIYLHLSKIQAKCRYIMLYHGASWESFCRHSVNTRWTFAAEKQPELPKRILTCSCWRVSSDPSDLSLPRGEAGDCWEHMKDDVDKMNYPLFKPSKDPKNLDQTHTRYLNKNVPGTASAQVKWIFMVITITIVHWNPQQPFFKVKLWEICDFLTKSSWWKNPANHLGCQTKRSWYG